MIHKYIRHSTMGFILWPEDSAVYHAHVSHAILRVRGVIQSAGFAYIDDGKVRCHGRSESLNIPSQHGDSAALAQQLGLIAC